MAIRIGLGKDSHRFLTEQELQLDESHRTKSLVLGGVVIAGATPFKAHSDGDAVYHAVFNAISSALGKKSIGHYFPDTSPEEKDRDSADYLHESLAMLKKSKLRVGNLSIVIECQKPKIDPVAEQMKANISELLDLSADSVGIIATTGEGITPWGQGIGIEVLCTVLLEDS